MAAMKQADLASYLNFPNQDIALRCTDVNVDYATERAIFGCNCVFPKNKITALIGPSGSGKSTLLRCLNRMNDGRAQVSGTIDYEGTNLNDQQINVYQLRQKIGMLFQQSNPFARSIYFNLAFGIREHQAISKSELEQRMREVLEMVDLWSEISGDLQHHANHLSGGQQQRLCLARTLMLHPDILLLDEPASALDPIATAKIEANLLALKKDITIIIVTHNLEQAARISDYTAFFYQGHLVEYDRTKQLFLKPHQTLTADYLSGNFG